MNKEINLLYVLIRIRVAKYWRLQPSHKGIFPFMEITLLDYFWQNINCVFPTISLVLSQKLFWILDLDIYVNFIFALNI